MHPSTSHLILLLVIFNSAFALIKNDYPVPLPPGGRNAVHGWLILPWDQQLPNPQDPAAPVYAWFSHHVPEFYTNSPHDWQIIMSGTLVPMSVAENITVPIDIPYPPASNLLSNEFTFTPPPRFSLNDLLTGAIIELKGVVYNGSFDTPYERYAMALATLDIIELTTAVYLNESTAIPSYPFQRYLSYPRSYQQKTAPTSGVQHYYFAHEIHAVPDFDQIVHVTIDLDGCFCSNSKCGADAYKKIYQAGAEWTFIGRPNDLEHRLSPKTTPIAMAQLNASPDVHCKVQVLEQIHCTVGPGFFETC